MAWQSYNMGQAFEIDSNFPPRQEDQFVREISSRQNTSQHPYPAFLFETPALFNDPQHFYGSFLPASSNPLSVPASKLVDRQFTGHNNVADPSHDLRQENDSPDCYPCEGSPVWSSPMASMRQGLPAKAYSPGSNEIEQDVGNVCTCPETKKVK